MRKTKKDLRLEVLESLKKIKDLKVEEEFNTLKESKLLLENKLEELNKIRKVEKVDTKKDYKYTMVFDNKKITTYFNNFLKDKDINLDFISKEMIEKYKLDEIRKLLIDKCKEFTKDCNLRIEVDKNNKKKALENSRMSYNEYLNFTIDSLLLNNKDKSLKRFKTLIKNYYKFNNLTLV